MSRIKTVTEQKLGRPVQEAALVHYPGWFQQEALRRQFRGPLAIPLRSLTDGVGRREREAGQAALAAAGLPDTAILAVTDEGVHVMSTKVGMFAISPKDQVLLLSPGTYTASNEVFAFTAVVTMTLPSGHQVAYEAHQGLLPRPMIAVIGAIVASSQHTSYTRDLATSTTRPATDQVPQRAH